MCAERDFTLVNTLPHTLQGYSPISLSFDTELCPPPTLPAAVDVALEHAEEGDVLIGESKAENDRLSSSAALASPFVATSLLKTPYLTSLRSSRTMAGIL